MTTNRERAISVYAAMQDLDEPSQYACINRITTALDEDEQHEAEKMRRQVLDILEKLKREFRDSTRQAASQREKDGYAERANGVIVAIDRVRGIGCQQ